VPQYRTPGDSEFTEALGWVIWNFLYLEEVIVAWLCRLRPDMPVNHWRRYVAGEKGEQLRKALQGRELDHELDGDLTRWLCDYSKLVKDARNATAHGHAVTLEQGGPDWRPALAHTDRQGEEWLIARSPDDLHRKAAGIEALLERLYDLQDRLWPD
jgi:hypothetical protein